MARRERTTGLPRAERRERRATAQRTFAGIPINDGTVRVGLFGLAFVLLVLIVGMFGWFYYQDNYVRPDKVVLRVNDREVNLRYYADRLYQFAVANPNAGSTVSQQLLTKLEEEELLILMAEERGIDLSEAAVERYIGLDLAAEGATEPLTGDEYTRALRDELRLTGYGRDVYERLSRAALANDELLKIHREEVGTTGEAVDYRVVVVGSENEANEALSRINGGEPIADVAGEVSLDVESKAQGGLVEGRVLGLLVEELRTAFDGKVEGDLFGPIEASGNWFIFQLEGRTADAELSEEDQETLAQARLDEAVDAFRETVTRERSLSASDYEWATDHVNTGSS